MIEERTEELAALYAFDLLSTEEKAAFSARLKREPELRVLVRELTEAAAGLAHAAPVAGPSPALRERILRDAAPRAEVIRFPRNAWVPWSIAAAVALMAALVGQTFSKAKQENLALRAETARLQAAQTDAAARLKRLESEALALQGARRDADQFRQDSLLARADLNRLQQENLALREKDLISQLKIETLASLVEESPDALAVAVWDEKKQQGVLTCEKLPPLDADKDYQLWVVDAAYPIPVDGGVFHPDVSGSFQMKFNPDKPITSTTPRFAVSLERKGGVPKAEGPMILLSK